MRRKLAAVTLALMLSGCTWHSNGPVDSVFHSPPLGITVTMKTPDEENQRVSTVDFKADPKEALEWWGNLATGVWDFTVGGTVSLVSDIIQFFQLQSDGD